MQCDISHTPPTAGEGRVVWWCISGQSKMTPAFFLNIALEARWGLTVRKDTENIIFSMHRSSAIFWDKRVISKTFIYILVPRLQNDLYGRRPYPPPIQSHHKPTKQWKVYPYSIFKNE